MNLSSASNLHFDALTLDLPLPVQKSFYPRKTILLAEDDDDLRFVMEHTLTTMGYSVCACADGQLATAAFHARSCVDILLTDFEMPGKSGIELARELTILSPQLPIVLITGSHLSTEVLREIRDRKWVYITKPNFLPTLAATLRNTLEPGVVAVA